MIVEDAPLDFDRAGRACSWDGSFLELSPLFWPLRSAAEALRATRSCHFPPPEQIDVALHPRAGVRFERQRPTPRRRRGPRDLSSTYDARIRAGFVPTRPGSWHDLMNALVWATFPQAKQALHQRQFEQAVPTAPCRSRELDALALFDEGGLLVVADARLEDELAVERALREREATAILFGHAIYEGLVLGREMPLASVICLQASREPTTLLSRMDHALTALLADRSEMRDPSVMLRLRVAHAFGEPQP